MRLQQRQGAGDLAHLEVESPELIMKGGVLAPAPVPAGPAGRCEVGGPGGSGRQDAKLPATEWQQAWRLDGLPGIRALLTRGKRALAVGASWALIDAEEGEVVARGTQPEGGVMSLDPEADLLYAAEGRLSVASTTDGAYAFGADLLGRGPARVMARHEDLLWVATADEGEATLELFELTTTSAAPRGALRCELSGAAHVASRGGWAVLAAEDQLLWCDPELSTRCCTLPEGTQVLGLSLDEGGRVHAVVSHEGRNQLWVLAPPGERLLLLRPLQGKPLLPCAPLLAADHSFALLAEGHLLRAGYEGHRWAAPTRGPLAGATLLADHLLSCERDRLVAYGAEGARRQLHHFSGQTLAGAPVVTDCGRVLVRAGAGLVALEPQAH